MADAEYRDDVAGRKQWKSRQLTDEPRSRRFKGPPEVTSGAEFDRQPESNDTGRYEDDRKRLPPGNRRIMNIARDFKGRDERPHRRPKDSKCNQRRLTP